MDIISTESDSIICTKTSVTRSCTRHVTSQWNSATDSV